MSEPPALLPIPDERSEPFFAGAREGRLMLQRCGDCGRWQHPVRAHCSGCGGRDLAWEAASGRGVVYSHARLHRGPPGLARALPLVLAVVDLDEGVRMNANLIDSDGTRVRAGARVEVAFEALSDEISIPVFRARER